LQDWAHFHSLAHISGKVIGSTVHSVSYPEPDWICPGRGLHSEYTVVTNNFITSAVIAVSCCEDARILHSSSMPSDCFYAPYKSAFRLHYISCLLSTLYLLEMGRSSAEQFGRMFCSVRLGNM